MLGLRIGLAKSCPEPESSIACGDFRADAQAATFEIQQHFAPSFLAFSKAFANSNKPFLSIFCCAHDYEKALCIAVITAHARVNTVSPEVNIALFR